MSKYQKPQKIQQIAKERITILFLEAQKRFSESPKLSNRYVQLARKIAMKYKVPIPREFKRRFCKRCFHYWMPGKNVRIRTHLGHMVYQCKDCKAIMRFVYRK